ncbi:Hsp70 family protein [Arthrobacter sp. B1I2]|uniref:Hsp70 family protein n=1 Tax=Arthrobacter sp. B1I2 TaxID=3042263 RepID=UPI002789B775|nr:Hsp70 family protein [Arthrobacter sp. B1I2]MDQ0733198.1 molecular chaperone DnaK (HSP70) [Arthrobacter sp. B1I2]
MSRAIGIDLGTTYSAVAILRDTGEPEVLLNRDGENITPSVALFQSFDGRDEPLVGTMAKHSAASAPEDAVQFVKRNIGDPAWRFTSTAGTTYTAEEISAIILRRLKEDAELALGEPVTDAVITVPAYFDDARRTATKHAGKIAGLNVLRVLNEPTAAALSFGLDTSAEGTVLVYDLGGGTFDVTLMRIGEGEFDVLGTDGDRNLGGFDFDNRLIEYIAGKVEEQGGPNLLDDPAQLAVLREKSEMAKRSLTTVAVTNVHVSAEGRPYRVQIERAEFERITMDLLRRTQDLTEHVLEEAGISWAQVDHVLLVGGSTRMPKVRATVEQLAGRPADRSVHPDEAVALGAAIQAAMEDSATSGADIALFEGVMPVIADVTSQSLGVIQVDANNGRDVNTIVIPRNSKIPAKLSAEGFTAVDNQTSINVRVTQGDDTNPDYVVEIGSKELPVPPYPKGAPVRVTYAYDIDQTVFVELTDLTANQSLGTFEIDRLANLTDDQVRAAAHKVSSLSVQ